MDWFGFVDPSGSRCPFHSISFSIKHRTTVIRHAACMFRKVEVCIFILLLLLAAIG